MTVIVSKPAVNLREKLAELDKPAGIAGEAMLRAETPQEQQALIGVGRRNFVINGDFQVSQRGDYSSATTITSGNYWVDRWKYEGSPTNTCQNAEVTLPTGQKTKSAKVLKTGAATSYIGMVYAFEDYRTLSEQTVTFSFWYRTNSNNFVIRYSGVENLDFIGVGDGQWHKANVSYTLPTISAAGYSANQTGFYFATLSSIGGSVALQSGEYIELAQVQLELGKVATPFEHRSYGEELALCQRYYQKHDRVDGVYYIGPAATTDRLIFPVSLPVEMRATPTITAFDVAGTSGKVSILATNGARTDDITAVTYENNTRTINIGKNTADSAAGLQFGYQVDAEL